jgi:hypothetical protein
MPDVHDRVWKIFFSTHDERMHHYQRWRASITGLWLQLRKVIETERLAVVVMTRLVVPKVGRLQMGFKPLAGKPDMKMKRLPSEP